MPPIAAWRPLVSRRQRWNQLPINATTDWLIKLIQLTQKRQSKRKIVRKIVYYQLIIFAYRAPICIATVALPPNIAALPVKVDTLENVAKKLQKNSH